MPTRKETDLYPPVKQFLADQGYAVRGEVRGCDLVAVRGEELVIVELKAALNLTLFLQGVERLALTDAVYLAVESPKRTTPHWTAARMLCRRLGLGLLIVRFARTGPRVEVLCDPEPYRPRPARKERRLLLGEFQKRSGDHNAGGSTKRPLVTAYREEALRAARELAQRGPSRVRDLREATGNDKVGLLLQRDVYGWFRRVDRGIYELAPKGREALALYADVVANLK